MKKIFKNVYVWLLIVILPLAAYGATKLTSVIIENSTFTGGTISGANISASAIGGTSPSTGIFTNVDANTITVTGPIGSAVLPLIRVTSGICTPASGPNGISCSVVISLGTILPDTNYAATCSGSTNNGAFTNITVSQVGKSTSTMTVYLTAAVVPARTYDELDCIVIGS